MQEKLLYLQVKSEPKAAKSGTYQMVMSGTYLVCLGMMQVKMPTLLFGITCILFCILYSAAACILVYKFAPKTFRLRT